MIPLVTALSMPAAAAERWSTDRAWAWHEAQPRLLGFNYVPSTAVNDVAIWQADTFDPETIDRELGWAAEVGFNTLRIFLQYVVWEADPDGFLQRLERFLSLAARHGLSVMPVLFDDCAFAGQDPIVGPQEQVTPGTHNSRWAPSPGHARVRDRAAWPKLREYVRAVVAAHRDDPRVLAWDLYNEPGNSGMGNDSLPLVEAAFAWAREAGPRQPLTVGVWTEGLPDLNRVQVEQSDVISFHNYGPVDAVRADIQAKRVFARPLICTETIARTLGSNWASHLPLFREQRVGCYAWGLVAGQTQTLYPWGSEAGAPEPVLWFHDLFRPDGTPFDPGELITIGRNVGKLQVRAIWPTSEAVPLQWRYTTEAPPERWVAPDFDDSAWQTGNAPFGVEEPQFSRHPRTEWRTGDLWLRRTFTLDAVPTGGLYWWLYHDDDAELYLNGVCVCRAAGYTATYAGLPLSAEAKQALRVGENLLALHVTQHWGGQYADVGLVEVTRGQWSR